MIPIDIKSGSKKLIRIIRISDMEKLSHLLKLKDIFEFETNGLKEPHRWMIFFP